jgi:hypothetical protein
MKLKPQRIQNVEEFVEAHGRLSGLQGANEPRRASGKVCQVVLC